MHLQSYGPVSMDARPSHRTAHCPAAAVACCQCHAFRSARATPPDTRWWPHCAAMAVDKSVPLVSGCHARMGFHSWLIAVDGCHLRRNISCRSHGGRRMPHSRLHGMAAIRRGGLQCLGCKCRIEYARFMVVYFLFGAQASAGF